MVDKLQIKQDLLSGKATLIVYTLKEAHALKEEFNLDTLGEGKPFLRLDENNNLTFHEDGLMATEYSVDADEYLELR